MGLVCYRRPGYLAYRRGSSRNPLRSLIRFVRKLEWSRIGATLLALLVGFTLTLVCQGHIRDNHHAGPHLTFLGDPLDNHHLDAHNVSLNHSSDSTELGSMDIHGMSMPDMNGSQPEIPSMYMPGTATFAAGRPPTLATAAPPNSIGANIGSAVTDPPLDTTLGLMLLLPLLRRGLNLRPLEMAVTSRRKSQTSTAPEPPPPRPSPC
jgi:hypothetical protein